MHLIEKALGMALQAHAGQTDKAGQPYILHPLRLMAKMDELTEKVVALLHDVIEDGGITAGDLRVAGFPEEAVEAVQLLTRQEGESYEDFIERVCLRALARKVKKADIEDNMDLLRLGAVSDYDLCRVAKYHRAWQRLDAADRQS